MKRLSDVLRETEGQIFRDDEFATHLERVGASEDDLPADQKKRPRLATFRADVSIAKATEEEHEQARLEMFDRATARQLARQSKQPVSTPRSGKRGWAREELYERDRTD